MSESVLELPRPDDWHVHLRDGAMMESVAPLTARDFGRAIVMPNTRPPITTVAAAKAYRQRIRNATACYPWFEPLMTAYLTDTIDGDEIERGYQEGVFAACKLYPANATTNSAEGVSDLAGLAKIFERLQKCGMPLLIHGEIADPEIDIFDREARFVDDVLGPLVRDFPALRVVLEHVTTTEAVDFVASAPRHIAATITAHHLMLNRNDLLAGGIRPHHYCLPIVKREKHRLALRSAATSGDPSFFLGTDSAPHTQSSKESACGCAGIFTAPVALAAYATVFEEEGALGRLEGFASRHGAAFYGLEMASARVRLVRRQERTPATIDAGESSLVRIFGADSSLPWRVERPRD